jgi:nucleotide-binding universal stress UspA family protein
MAANADLHARKVMIAMDGSAESWYAVKWGIENVVRFGDNVLILYVGPKEEETGDYSAKALMWEKGGTPFIPLGEFGSLERFGLTGFTPELTAELDQLAKDLKLTIFAQVYFGNAKDKIVKAAEQNASDLIVIGSRGLGKFQRLFSGSVSAYVVEEVDCPVVVVKLPGKK